ncbi:UNC5C-like protein isoform X1 [Alligator mississippiensis]|nr:UNC5C-like protein isoform X1 [Alligator mississippiensis]
MERFLEQSLLTRVTVVSIFVTSVLLLSKCLYSWCPKLPCLRYVERRGRQGMLDSIPVPLPNLEVVSTMPCPTVTLEEVEGFYRELHTPTGGRMVVKQLLNKLLVYVGKEVDHRGDCLMLMEMGISLAIPPGAVALGQTKKVSLVLIWDLSDSPPLSSSQALISPVVYCGPHGSVFQKPCQLVFKHCAGSATQARAYTSNTDLLSSKVWCPVQDREELKARTTRDECQIQLLHFSLYTCVLEAPWNSEARKWLQLAIFCSPLAADQTHFQIRIYFLNNTPCALQWAVTNEQPFRGGLCGPVQIFNFTGRTKDMCLALKYLSDGWENVDDSSCQVVPHLHIWHGRCPFRSFCFRRKQNEEGAVPSGEIIVTMHTYQSGLEKKYMEILRFQAPENGSQMTRISSSPLCNRMPRELFEQLQMLLEPNSISGNDWRKLASRLGLCGMKIRYFSCQESPAAATLEIFEEQNGSLKDLYNIMVAMDRLDCASAIKSFLNGTGNRHCCTLATSPHRSDHQLVGDRQSPEQELQEQGQPMAWSPGTKMPPEAYENQALEVEEEEA